MTVKGYGIRCAEFLREKDGQTGLLDRDYVGRTLRILVSSGGELLLQVTPGELLRLKQACEEEMKTLEHTTSGWHCVDGRPAREERPPWYLRIRNHLTHQVQRRMLRLPSESKRKNGVMYAEQRATHP